MTNTTNATTEGADPAVLVIGGYGAVGGGIVRTLLRDSRCHVLVAGRSLERARGFCQALGPRATAVALGERSLLAPEASPHRVTVVVNCVEEASPRIAMQCQATDIHYVDISATASVLDAVRSQWMADALRRSSAVLSVGVAPGLTNLLVREARDRLGPLRHADITVLLGAGEVHGLAAIRWTLDRLGTAFTVQTTAGQRAVRAFGEARPVWLAAPHGRRTAYRFDFSDQHTLPRTLTLQSAATWLCFDSRLVTQAFAWMARLRVRRWLPAYGLAKSLAWVAAHAPVGGSGFMVQVDALSQAGDRASWAVAGDGEATCTAAVAAKVARTLLAARLTPGAHHIEEVLTLDEVLKDCASVLRRVESNQM
ncbi:MAG: saccharopine dehydrogenase NADP-binding domain-containing protein [Zoogloea sp.]|nr:saccharopine dehydrogenase NADP-binding domain-containing protein [Zoogloea sp.]